MPRIRLRLSCAGLYNKAQIREYVQEFSQVILQISNLDEKGAFLSFMDGLKP